MSAVTMLALLTSASVGFTQAQTFKLDGVVIDAKSNRAVADASILVRDTYGGEIASATTDELGVYHASFVSSATNPSVTIEVTRAGYISKTSAGYFDGLQHHAMQPRLLCTAAETEGEVGCVSYDDVAIMLHENGVALNQSKLLQAMEGIGELSGANGTDTMLVMDAQGDITGLAQPLFNVSTSAMSVGKSDSATLSVHTFKASIVDAPSGLNFASAGVARALDSTITPLYSNDIYRDINCDEGRGYWTRTELYGLPDNTWCQSQVDQGVCVGCCASNMSTCTAGALTIGATCATYTGWSPWAIACGVATAGMLGACKYWENKCSKGCRKHYPCCVAPDGSRFYNGASLKAAEAKRKDWVQATTLSGGWGFRWCTDKVFLNSQQGPDFVFVELDLSGYMAREGYGSHWELSFGRSGDMILEARVTGIYDQDTDTFVVSDIDVKEDRYVAPDFLLEFTKKCGETIDVYRALP